MIVRDWFWQIQASGQGPDWFLVASFAADDAGRLAALVAQQPLPGFARYQARAGARQGHRSDHDIYIDQVNYAVLAANLEGGRPQNIWVYHMIEVCGADLTLERGYGGYPDAHGTTETDLIRTLARQAELTLGEWSVGYGGQGYPSGQVAAGSGAARLLAYLEDVEPSPALLAPRG
jgi:hypothetical protein